MPSGTIVVSLERLPEVLWAMRQEFARMLRREAESEAHPFTARRLRALAARFEVGASSEEGQP